MNFRLKDYSEIRNEFERRKTLFNIYSIILGLLFVFYAIKDFVLHRNIYAIFFTLFFALILVNFIIFTGYKKIAFSVYILTFISFFSAFTLFAYMSNSLYDLFWFFAFPLLVTTLHDNIYVALIFSFLLLISVFVFTYFSQTIFLRETVLKFVIAYLIITLFAFYSRVVFNKLQKAHQTTLFETKQKNEELEAAEEELRQTIEELQIAYDNLDAKEKHIAQNEQNLEKIVQNIGEGLAIVDLNENIIYANPSSYKIFNANEETETLIGKNLKYFISKEELIKVSEQTKLRKHNVKSTYDLILTFPDNTQKKIIVTAVPYFDSEQKLIGTLGVFRDITEILEIQKTLQLRNEELITAEEELRQVNDELLIKQDELLNNQERLHTILDNVQIGIIISDPVQHKINYANPAAANMIKKSVEELNGDNCTKYLCYRKGDCDFRKYIDNDEPENSEDDLIDNFGENIHILKTVIPIDYDGKMRLLESFIDISELHEAQQTIIQQKSLFENLINNIPDFIYMKDEHLRYMLVNSSLANDLGMPPSEIVGKNVTEFLTPELADFYNRLDNFVIKTKNSVFDIEQKFVSPQGKERWTLVTKIPLFDNKNNVYAVIGISRDVTDRKREEAIILEKNRQFENTIANLEDIYFKTDMDGNLINASPSLLRHLEYDSLSEIIENKVFDQFYKNSSKAKQKFLESIRENESIKRHPVQFKTKNGHKFYGVANVTVWYDNHNNPQGLEGIIANTTELYKLQRELSFKNEILNISLELTNNQKSELEKTHKNLTDNIDYAKTIQESLLPSIEIFGMYFNQFFLIYKPKDVVSGDFYYLNKVNNNLIFAVGDCTGHGVTGAFMTILSISYLHQIVLESEQINAADVLNRLRMFIKQTFRNFGNENNNGLDFNFCSIALKTNLLQYAGANLPLFIYRNGSLIEFAAVRNPIGHYLNEISFKQHEFYLQNNDNIYLFSDGYKDQITNNSEIKLKKFGILRFRKILQEIQIHDFQKQKEILENSFSKWKGSEEQIDDITVLGINWVNSLRK